MRFDAYSASIRQQKINDVAEILSESLGGIVARGKAMPRFGETLNIDVGNRMAAWVGKNEKMGLIYVEGKGETSPELAAAIREHFPQHSVPRVDVCEDVDEPGAFERLQALIRETKGPRVKGGYVALPDDVEDGRTWAAGVRGGIAYLRLYEAGKHPDRVQFGRPNWVRPELECRPHYARDKEAAATMTPKEVWGFTSWTKSVGEALMQTTVARFEPEVREYTYSKTDRYLAMTFRRHWEEKFANGEDVRRTFEAIWQEQAEWDKKIRAGLGR